MRVGTAVLGAGLAGMSAAMMLDDYHLFEREARIGGLCRTRWLDGFGFDHAIHVLYSKDHALARLICDELLQGRYRELQRSAWVYSHGRMIPYPFQAHLYGLPEPVISECVAGVAQARAAPSRTSPANFAEWIRSTFGDGIARHFMLPYNRKVWAVPPEQMSYEWIADRVPVPTVSDVLRGARTPSTKRIGLNALFWYPTEGGIEELARGLSRRLDPARVHVSTEVTGVDWESRTLHTANGGQFSYREIISSLALPALLSLMPRVPERVVAAGKQLKWNRVYTVMLGLGRPSEVPYHWVYFAEPEFIFHRVSFPSNFSHFMAPTGCSSVMAEISVPPNEEWSRASLEFNVLDGLRRCGLLGRQDPILVTDVVPLSPGYVILDAARLEAASTIRAWLDTVDIHAVGRFGEWEYFNMDQAIASGIAMGEAIGDARRDTAGAESASLRVHAKLVDDG